jgi:D-glycero-alpha-D-manno-heptose 1-phosphate guanylyltransferase
VTAAILAGGLATRLRPALPDTAKAIARVAGKPFLYYVLAHLVHGGVDRIVLCTGFRSPQVEAEIGAVFKGIPVEYSVEEKTLGTGGAIGLAWRNFADGGPVWIVANGDSYLDLNVPAFLAEHEKSGCAASISALHVADGARYGTLEWSPETRLVTAFREKTGETGAAWINGGVYAFKPAFLDTLPHDQSASLEKEVFPRWIKGGLHVYPVEGQFIDIGTPESYSQAQSFFEGTLPK